MADDNTGQGPAEPGANTSTDAGATTEKVRSWATFVREGTANAVKYGQNILTTKPGWSTAAIAALTALAAVGLPNKTVQNPDGTERKKAGVFKTAVVVLGGIASATLLSNAVGPKAGWMGKVSQPATAGTGQSI